MLKFSLAHLLILIAVISVFSGFLSFADGGSQIAVGLLYALPLMAIPMLIMAVFYWIAFPCPKRKSNLRSIIHPILAQTKWEDEAMNFQTNSPSQILKFAIFGLLLCGSANLGLAQNNFKFTVQDKWPVSNKGYYRIKFELSDTLNAALTRDRQFNIVAAPQGLGSPYSPQDCISKKRVTIQAGTNLVEGEILVPVNSQAGNLIVFVDANDNLKRDDKELLYKEIDLTQTAPWNDFRILYVDNRIG